MLLSNNREEHQKTNKKSRNRICDTKIDNAIDNVTAHGTYNNIQHM
jgi:hypothetical protein